MSLAARKLPVAVLHEQAAEDALVVTLGLYEGAALHVVQDPHRRLARERLHRLLVVAGREQHLDELPRESLSERGGHAAVEDDDAAVGRDRVGGERALVGVLDPLSDRDPARVRVLDDHARRGGRARE